MNESILQRLENVEKKIEEIEKTLSNLEESYCDLEHKHEDLRGDVNIMESSIPTDIVDEVARFELHELKNELNIDL